MSRILLLLDHKNNRRLLWDWLSRYHEVFLPDEKNPELLFLSSDSGSCPIASSAEENKDIDFDLCILDGLALDRVWQWVQARRQVASPVFLPFLLLTSRQEVGIATRHLWQSVDELIISPIEKVELQARVEILLRSRNLSLQLQSANKELQKHSELKSRLVSMVSHEIRNPLSLILGFAKIIESHFSELSLERILEYLKQIILAVNRMDHLAEGLLVIGRLDLGKQDFNPIPIYLENFCISVAQEIEFTNNNQHKIIFRTFYATDSELTATHVDNKLTNACMDENLLQYILSNLLSNAVKYSPVGSSVHFDFICDGDRAIFQIEDEGIGIPKQEQPRLFEAFHRASNVGKIGGNGLGLCIVKQCVDLHGGKIEFTSEVGMGTKFTVTLPLKVLE
ncbi:sensor histidine kinase [Argonema antarcticum]|uniref:ATP-binding response regulator n=1 Tax=Argonema antarcticum TaxID=2942763 RepID=UPI002010E3D4|nr:HAMP domain-containing sensor histidine kinase [Argonema antarcticum]MCL1470488.1 HAMP domain-containing histidine kinase [Argonema antarcticum A004/B2]